MVNLAQSTGDEWELAEIDESFLILAIRNQTKPGRRALGEQFVLHADASWTATHWESPAEEVGARMFAELARVLGRELAEPEQVVAHRWKYATPLQTGQPQAEQPRCFSACEDRIIACGDWTSGTGVEGAFLSGAAAAGRILNRLLPARKALAPIQRELF
jgi:predicted NAD/FAD-dependent oxidoreductase